MYQRVAAHAHPTHHASYHPHTLSYPEVLAAFDNVLRCLKNIGYYQAVGNRRARLSSLAEAQDNLRSIAASIEPDPHAPAAENLVKLLHFIIYSLDTTARSNKSRPVQEAVAMLQPLRDTFASMC